MNKTGKYLFLLLALCLLMGLLPVTAFATGTTVVSTWEGLQAALSVGGDIVLTADVTPENPYWADALTVPSGVTATLDLNSHSVDRGYGNQTGPGWDGSVLIISGTLTVTDSDPEMRGAITGGFPDQYGGGVQIWGGVFNLQGGSITGNRAGETGLFGTDGLGGGVYMQSGTFNMSGGSISGNKALGPSMGSSLGRGGGVYVTGGTFNFTGGTISGNTAGSIGGGVYLASTSSGHDGKIYVSGDATVTDNTVAGAASNVYLEEGGVLTVAGELNGTIGVTMQAPGVFTSGWKDQMGETADPAEYFTSDDAGLVVSLTDAGEAKLGVEEYPLWVGGVQATSANKGDVLGDGTNVTYNPETQTLTFPENITLTGADSDVVIYAVGQDLTIQAPNGLTLNNRDATYGISTGSKALTVETGGVLAITVKDYGIDAGSGGVTVTGNVNITVGEQGIMTNGPVTVTGDVTIRSGGTYGIDARGKVELNGNIDIEANGFCILTYGDIALDYGTCTLTNKGSSYYAIHGNNITLEGTSLTAMTRANGFDCVLALQKLTLVRGDFSFTGGSRAIQANGDIEIRSGVIRVYGKCTSTSDSVICAYNNGEIKLADSLRIVTPEDGYIDNTNYSKIVDKNGNNVTEVVIEKPTAYTVTFDPNGGTGAPAAQTKVEGQNLTLPTEIPNRYNNGAYVVTYEPNGGTMTGKVTYAQHRTYFRFLNWNTAKDGSGTSYAPGAVYTAEEAVTLYAQWVKNGEATASIPLPTPKLEGHVFQGWATSTDLESGMTGRYKPTADITLYATWTIGTYTISFDTDGGTEIAPITGEYGTEITAVPEAPTKPGYVFKAWDKAIPETMPGEDLVIKAIYEAQPFGEADVTLPEYLSEIEEEAFEGAAMKSVYVPDSVETIGANAFGNCAQLEKLRLPQSCAIDETAFTGCKALAIYAPAGGTVEEFCETQGISFVPETAE